MGHSCSNTPPGFLHSLRQGFRHFFLHLLGFSALAQSALQSFTSWSFLQSFLQNLLPHFGNSGNGESGGGDGGDGEGGGGLGEGGGGLGEGGGGEGSGGEGGDGGRLGCEGVAGGKGAEGDGGGGLGGGSGGGEGAV